METIIPAIGDHFIGAMKSLGESLFGGDPCGPSAAAWGSLGAVSGIFFANAGAAYGLAVSFYGYAEMGKNPKTDRLMLIKGLVPGIMASVRGVYGLIIGILIATQLKADGYAVSKGIAQLCAGLCVGLSGLASGYSMGVVGDAGLRAVGQKPILYTSFLLLLIFCEALGLYGLIVGLIINSSAAQFTCP